MDLTIIQIRLPKDLKSREMKCNENYKKLNFFVIEQERFFGAFHLSLVGFLEGSTQN